MVDAFCIQGNKVDRERAGRIAEEFHLEVTEVIPEGDGVRYFLMDKNGISFVCGGQSLRGDFTRLLPRVTGGHLQHEILLKTAGATNGGKQGEGVLRAVDATAGLGEDSFLLAAAGYQVEMFEHNPVTAVLLGDALIRGKLDGRISQIVRRMSLRRGDSKKLLGELGYKPDLIYLDPMFPEKQGSAETKAKLQMLHRIEAPASDEAELLAAAMGAKPAKIIIKRPPGCGYLAGVKPTYSVERKAVRFDCLRM